MLNEGAAVNPELMKVLSGVELAGGVNVTEEQILDNIRFSIRQGHPQIRPDPMKGDRIALVGGGPSLNDPAVQRELRDLLWAGNCQLVTVNGAYHWAIEHNFRPNCQIVMDARASNSRFVQPYVPNCRYILGSQCHPETWKAVAGRPNVWIFHSCSGKDDDPAKIILDEYYNKQWWASPGGTTVTSHAIACLRSLGYLRYDLFGIDSCWGPAGEHHAYPQEENNRDRKIRVTISPEGHPELAKSFWCSPWHCKQAEDFIQMIRVNGERFLLNAHGDGLIAHLIQSGADAFEQESQERESQEQEPQEPHEPTTLAVASEKE